MLLNIYNLIPSGFAVAQSYASAGTLQPALAAVLLSQQHLAGDCMKVLLYLRGKGGA
jgi:hypothetical protein